MRDGCNIEVPRGTRNRTSDCAAPANDPVEQGGFADIRAPGKDHHCAIARPCTDINCYIRFGNHSQSQLSELARVARPSFFDFDVKLEKNAASEDLFEFAACQGADFL